MKLNEQNTPSAPGHFLSAAPYICNSVCLFWPCRVSVAVKAFRWL